MNKIGTQQINTERLILRRFIENDAENMYKNWATDEQVTRFLSWMPHKDLIMTKELIKLWCESYNSDETYNWGIELKEIGEVVGNISIVSYNSKNNSCEIGYCIGSKFWNKGITTEAFAAVIEFLLREVSINKVVARHDVDNPASGKVMLKCGLKLDGVLRDEIITKGSYRDLAVYSILKREVEN